MLLLAVPVPDAFCEIVNAVALVMPVMVEPAGMLPPLMASPTTNWPTLPETSVTALLLKVVVTLRVCAPR